MLKKGVFGQKGCGQKILRWLRPKAPVPLSRTQRPWPPEIFPARTATAEKYIQIYLL